MTAIRAFARDDLPAVCALYEQVMRSGSRTPAPALSAYFERIFLDDPWADPEIPSWVYEGPDGAIVGFTGVNVRRMRLDDRPLRVAVSSNLVAHPDWRARGVGALLNRKVMHGPQDLTIADRANDESRRMWLGLGGQELVHASLGWYRVLRPGSTVRALLDARGRAGAIGRGARLAASPLDAIAGRLPKVGAVLAPPAPDTVAEDLTPAGLLEQVGAAGRRLRLRPDYDATYLRWMFGTLEAVEELRGRLVARLVRGSHGRVLGWYLYLLPERGVAHVLQVGVPGDDAAADAVLDHLFADAHAEGAAAVHGRLEPALAGLTSRSGVIVRKTARALVHAEDPTVLALLGSPRALLSQLDGEWLVSHGAYQ